LKGSDKGSLRRVSVKYYYIIRRQEKPGLVSHLIFVDGRSTIPVMEAIRDCLNVQDSACYSF